ncbi:hypothetical protein BC833DRAFT_596127 [Globomyces pollinis-pini]|nr:hypothetical protein BC833DRAFT_596127 [Globomyces pollinis-pini]
MNIESQTQQNQSEETTPLLVQSSGPENSQKTELLGLLLMAFSGLMFSLMAVLVKVSGRDFDSAQIVFTRSVIQFVIPLFYCYMYNLNPLGPPGVSRIPLMSRGAAGALGLACYFYTLVNMPLGDGTSIFFMGPTLTSVLAYLALGEPFTKLDMCAVISCLTGVVLVSRPEFIFGAPVGTGIPHHYDVPVWIPSLSAFLGAVFSAIAYVSVRSLGNRVNYMINVVYFGGTSTVVSGIYLYGFGNPKPVSEWTSMQAMVILGVGFLAFAGQCFLNKGLQLANAGPATLMRNLDIIFAFIFGITLFNEIPQVTSIIGAVLIGGTTALVAFLKYNNSK